MGLLVECVALFLVVVGFRVVMGGSHAHAIRRYQDKFPPISDEEFVARCEPSVSLEVAHGVRQTIGSIFGIEAERIHPETNLIKLDNL
ncbi:MAG: hypothetical protein KDA86_01300 [Planctomycetaceae bacterium]|nr:hypothetical protein [Planctomycetaceae bacterium]MCA9108927.1 hypothetical protein [Planctomycetaceae bacterium]